VGLQYFPPLIAGGGRLRSTRPQCGTRAPASYKACENQQSPSVISVRTSAVLPRPSPLPEHRPVRASRTSSASSPSRAPTRDDGSGYALGAVHTAITTLLCNPGDKLHPPPYYGDALGAHRAPSGVATCDHHVARVPSPPATRPPSAASCSGAITSASDVTRSASPAPSFVASPCSRPDAPDGVTPNDCRASPRSAGPRAVKRETRVSQEPSAIGVFTSNDIQAGGGNAVNTIADRRWNHHAFVIDNIRVKDGGAAVRRRPQHDPRRVALPCTTRVPIPESGAGLHRAELHYTSGAGASSGLPYVQRRRSGVGRRQLGTTTSNPKTWRRAARPSLPSSFSFAPD